MVLFFVGEFAGGGKKKKNGNKELNDARQGQGMFR